MLSLALAVSSCGRKVVNIDDELPELPPPVWAETQPVSEAAQTAETTPGVVIPEHLQPKAPGLHGGLWYAYSDAGSSFYWIDANDPVNGEKTYLESGLKSTFRYEKREKFYLFHFDSEDNETYVDVEYIDQDHVRFLVSGTYTEELEFVSEMSYPYFYNSFVFYTNQELDSQARAFYAKSVNNPKLAGVLDTNIVERPGLQAIVQVTKQVFDKSVGVHRTEVCESYIVDRRTGEGVNSSGYAVDISQ